MRHHGRLSQWQDAKGYGFITPTKGGERVFVHMSAFKGRRPTGGEQLSYELKLDANGRLQAAHARIEGHQRQHSARSQQTWNMPGRRGALHSPSWALPAVFFAILVALTGTGQLPTYIPLVYLTLSAVTYVAYGWDKWSAKQNARRTPEKTLLMMGLAGGWPGALLAQQTLRHKSSKQSFQVQFWITVVANCGALLWLVLNHVQLG